MKTFLALVTMILLIYKVKDTPRMLNKKIFIKDIESEKERVKKTLDKYDEKDVCLARNFVIIVFMLRALAFIQYYRLVGNYVRLPWFTILGLFKMAMVVVSTINVYKYIPSVLEADFSCIKFSLFKNLCILIVDYVYCFVTIFYLVMR